jgi:hypothetical protein
MALLGRKLLECAPGFPWNRPDDILILPCQDGKDGMRFFSFEVVIEKEPDDVG